MKKNNALKRVSLCLLLNLAAGATAAADAGAQPQYRFAGPGPWIDVISLGHDDPRPKGEGVDGVYPLLHDRQIQVRATGDDYYQYSAVNILSTAGVSDRSQINITVDPNYQALDLHRLRILRGEEIIDLRETARITALPEETELENRIYNGRYNINILLSDVRVGDIVESAYTLRSEERVFPGHFATRMPIGWSLPVHRQRIRIVSELDRPMHLRSSAPTALPEAQAVGDKRVFVLDQTDVAAIAYDASAPHWYSPWPYLEVSDLESWAQVARRVEPIYAAMHERGPRLRAVAERIREQRGTLPEQALRALQHVQEAIRYTSISIGRGGYIPSSPETVLERGFGDCKDKSLLLSALLEQLGIDARPALVHSTRGKALDSSLPTPFAFDHVVVQARLGEETYWLDPTAPGQYAPLSVDRPADFEHALPIDSGSTTLAVIPRPAPDSRAREVFMVFDLRAGMDKPASLEVTTLYTGALADAMRPTFSGGNSRQRELDYVNYIARYYPGAESAGPIVIEDDKAANRIEVRERYTLETVLKDARDGTLQISFHADELYAYAEPLATSVRTAPLALEFPVRVRQHITAYLPESWPVENESVSIENPAFRYASTVNYQDRKLEIDYRYEALADHVPLAALQQYQADRRKFHDDVGYMLTHRGTSPLAIAPLPFLIILLALAASGWMALRWGYRYDPQPLPAAPGSPEGIRGWLILPALGVIGLPFAYLISAWQMLGFVDASAWNVLPSIVSESARGWIKPGMLAVIALIFALLVGQILLAILFFSKRSSAPRLYIAMLWFGAFAGMSIVLVVYASGLDEETTPAESIGDLISALIWTAYMLRSQRVRKTFTARWPGAVVKAGHQ